MVHVSHYGLITGSQIKSVFISHHRTVDVFFFFFSCTSCLIPHFPGSVWRGASGTWGTSCLTLWSLLEGFARAPTVNPKVSLDVGANPPSGLRGREARTARWNGEKEKKIGKKRGLSLRNSSGSTADTNGDSGLRTYSHDSVPLSLARLSLRTDIGAHRRQFLRPLFISTFTSADFSS